MLDHYYTPRDLPLQIPAEDLIQPMLAETDKPHAPRAKVVDLSALDFEQLAFDCDSGSESGSDDGYVSTLLRIQRALPVQAPATPRKIAGARRVARAVSSPNSVRTGLMVDLEVQTGPQRGGRTTPEGEVFQSITATPGLESTSFEELRLETYLQSLVATGTARPQPAFALALVIPPAFSAQFCEVDAEGEDEGDVEMEDATQPVSCGPSAEPHLIPAPAHPPFVFRASSYPPAHAQLQWG
ncbi:hypothetical protein C8R43DRAFT_1022726 [Mycena crocata]|nr:hypothetical protein C8R43DRAFT_1022726 [Mycena crocata]